MGQYGSAQTVLCPQVLGSEGGLWGCTLQSYHQGPHQLPNRGAKAATILRKGQSRGAAAEKAAMPHDSNTAAAEKAAIQNDNNAPAAEKAAIQNDNNTAAEKAAIQNDNNTAAGEKAETIPPMINPADSTTMTLQVVSADCCLLSADCCLLPLHHAVHLLAVM